MLTVIDLIGRLRAANIHLRVEGDRLLFRAPDGALTTALRAAVARHRSGVIEFLRSAHDTAERPPLMAGTRPKHIPLSYAQRRMRFLQTLEEAAATYNIPMALRIDGELNVPAMQAALGDVMVRHEGLRTIFPEQDGIPFQHILDIGEARFTLAVEPASEASLTTRLAKLAAIPFDLSCDMPLRVWLLQIEPTRHVLLLSLHHIVGDGASLAPLTRDLMHAYAARAQGGEPAWQPLPIQYADYTLWQLRSLGSEGDADSRMEQQLRFWRQALAAMPEELVLPADRPRPPVATHRGGVAPIRIDPVMHRRMLDLARQSRASVLMVLQAAIACLLSRLGAGDDIPIGTVASGRSEPGTEGLVGFLVNTLVLRTDVSGDPSFRQLVGSVRAFDLEAYERKDVPFERVVEAMRPSRSLARNPLFQIALSLQSAHDVLTLPDLTVVPEPIPFNRAKFDLSFALTEKVGAAAEPLGVEGGLEYCLDLFEPATAEALATRFVHLLSAALADPDEPLHRLNILRSSERRQLLHGFNATERTLAASTMPALFEAQVARRRHAPAVVLGEQSLSYDDLDGRANRLARHLIGLGVGPEILVGVCLDRSLEMITAIIAVLKAGGGYVPLDPAYPPARLASIIGDAKPAVVISTASACGSLPGGVERLLIDAAETWSAIEGASAQPVTDRQRTAPLHVGHPAYVIYTSGSTGHPKGVVVSHAGLPSLAAAEIDRLGVSPESRVLQFASLSFDASVAEIVMALAAGAALVLLPEADRSGTALETILIRDRVTHAILPPLVLATLDPARDLPLQGLIVAGEACPGALVARWSDRCGMVNAYGPTETTVCATMSGPLAGGAPPPIGAPICNVRVYVLDRWLEPLPIGVAGELYVSADGLARGYLGSGRLTAERFVADPHSSQSGARMYRTGDLARWRADGMLEFLGRVDDQLKIRGVRIEPKEVEAHMRSAGGIRDAAVVALPGSDGALTLAGYYVPEKRLELWPSIAEFYVYDDLVYTSMAQDGLRHECYRAAFARHLKDQVVVDVGTGPFAVLARWAVEAGARHVYAIELLEEQFHRAERVIAQHGLSDRITLLHGDARELTLPEPVDWCVSEIVGPIGGAEGAAIIIEQVRRLLRNGANMLPRRSVTRIAACALPESRLQFGFPETAASYVDRIFASVGRKFDLRLCVKGDLAPHLLSSVGVFEDLDFTGRLAAAGTLGIELSVTTAGAITGFLVWLTLQVDEGIELDILQDQASWLPVYVPVFPDGVAVEPGDRIAAAVIRTLSVNGLNPDFHLSGTLSRRSAPDLPFAVDVPHVATGFRQTPFHARLFAQAETPRMPRISPRMLREHLGRHLPPVAVPTSLTELEALPLTPNGKLDRHALPMPDRLHEPYRAPGTELECVLCDIFEEVLELERVGIDDDFFDIGGHSLMAMRLMSRVRSRLSVDTSVRMLFEARSVARLAERLPTTKTARPKLARRADAPPRPDRTDGVQR
jgi:amino acid adenylation domain-containing protein